MRDGMFNRKFQGNYNGMYNRIFNGVINGTGRFTKNLPGSFKRTSMRSFKGTDGKITWNFDELFKWESAR